MLSLVYKLLLIKILLPFFFFFLLYQVIFQIMQFFQQLLAGASARLSITFAFDL